MNDFGRKPAFHAELGMSSRSGVIVAISRGSADVQLPDGKIIKKVSFGDGNRYEVDQGVTIERVGDDWQAVGMSINSTSVES